MPRKIILASGSPRRRELLNLMGIEFEVVPSDFKEYLDHDLSAADMTMDLALGKARAVAHQYPDAFVIGSDTIVTLKGKHLGKAKDEAEARAVLHDHDNEVAVVTSSVVLVCRERRLIDAHADSTKVLFKPKDEAAIEAYLKTDDWKDKAGSWAIQSGAASLIRGFDGEYDTILGLPTKILAKLLQEQGYSDAHPAKLTPPKLG